MNVNTAAKEHSERYGENTTAKESGENWDVKACLFVTQEIGRFSVKFSAPCIGGTVNLSCSHITNACNPFDAVMRFSRETSAKDCTVYAVEQVEPVRPVCLSTTGYRFMQKGFIWLCLDTGVFVEVSDDGRMRCGDDGCSLPYYGTLTRI
ncbi:protein TraE [Serratia marcescens]|nr:protein TraE [Serratia marcescens]